MGANAEITAYNPTSGYAYTVGGGSGAIVVSDLRNPAAPVAVAIATREVEAGHDEHDDEREAAMEVLEDAGLEPMHLDSVYKDGADPHHVADQVPPPGSQIKGGRLVYLTTYRSQPPSESIGVKEGQDLAVARIILQNKGFRLTEVSEPQTTLTNKV
ncbi:MAG: PASTA domain-containing protein, partial [Flavobacteriales bacterium]